MKDRWKLEGVEEGEKNKRKEGFLRETFVMVNYVLQE